MMPIPTTVIPTIPTTTTYTTLAARATPATATMHSIKVAMASLVTLKTPQHTTTATMAAAVPMKTPPTILVVLTSPAITPVAHRATTMTAASTAAVTDTLIAIPGPATTVAPPMLRPKFSFLADSSDHT